MQDHELRELLLETCAIRPGQEGRAWIALQERLERPRGLWNSFSIARWRGVAATAAVMVLALGGGAVYLASLPRAALATADSQAPGIFATSFYSDSAQAQVVWLNGLDPASDKPTYLQPTRAIQNSAAADSAGDPNSL